MRACGHFSKYDLRRRCVAYPVAFPKGQRFREKGSLKAYHFFNFLDRQLITLFVYPDTKFIQECFREGVLFHFTCVTLDFHVCSCGAGT